MSLRVFGIGVILLCAAWGHGAGSAAPAAPVLEDAVPVAHSAPDESGTETGLRGPGNLGALGGTGSAPRPNGALQTATFKPLLEYRGSYICNQGITAVTLWVAEDTAVFFFHAHPDNPGVPSGSYSMQGQVDLSGGAMHLKAVQWMKQPEGYVMVDLDGVSHDGGLSFQGKVIGPNCSSFSVARAQRRDLPAPVR